MDLTGIVHPVTRDMVPRKTVIIGNQIGIIRSMAANITSKVVKTHSETEHRSLVGSRMEKITAKGGAMVGGGVILMSQQI